MWTDWCISRNTPVLGGKIVAEYDSLTKKVTQLYSIQELVLPEDESKIFDEILKIRHKSTAKEVATKMETSNRPQHETSEGIGKRK